jgi:hypothetical protein
VSRRTPWAAAVLAAVLGSGLTACVKVPSTGPVVSTQQSVQATQNQNPDNNPPPPRPGMVPSQIVSGFLDAMTATPLQTSTAQQFLTAAGRALWQPQQNVVAYDTLRAPPRGTTSVEVQLKGADRVGSAGQWLGRLGPSASRLTFPMRLENGEWRIAVAPNALLVPRTFYDQTFQDATLYFFDPSARILVPEVVHMPQGQQFTTALTQALVLGPQPSLAGVARSFIPAGLTVGPVVVSRGVADVTLRGTDPGPLSRRSTRLMVTQLAWTLGQDPTVKAISVNIAGRQVATATGSSTFRVDAPEITRYDPTRPKSSSQLYALRRGRLVSGQATRLTPVDGPFGATAQGIEAFAVSLDDGRVAGKTPNALLVGPVRSVTGVKPTEVLTGPGLLRPSWDFAGRLWEVQNTGRGGAVVRYIEHGRSHEVHVPGISGQDVDRFLVSRDASRLVAVVHGASHDRLLVSRLRYDPTGGDVSGTRARALRWSAGGSTRIRDIGWWLSPTAIAVLDQVTPAQAEVRVLDVDGSTSPVETPPINVRGVASGLVTSPVTSPVPQTPYAVQPGALLNLAQVDTTTQQPVPGLDHITYAG